MGVGEVVGRGCSRGEWIDDKWGVGDSFRRREVNRSVYVRGWGDLYRVDGLMKCL